MALPFSAYVGRYENVAWGLIEVALRDGKLVVRNGALESVSEVYDGAQHQIRVELEPATGRVLAFRVENGRPTALEYNGIRFARVP
jgi:hypothetical protein